jgi:hypothetical protein
MVLTFFPGVLVVRPEPVVESKRKQSAMKLNIDVSGVQFFCTRAAQARTDRDTGVPRIDRETGLPLWQLQVAALDATGGEVLAITVVGDPSVNVGQPVTIEGLVAIPWTQGDRSGVAYRATSIRPSGSPIHAGGSSDRPGSGSKAA